MITYIVIGILAVLVCLISHNRGLGLKIAFLIITVFLGIRYMWGSDYPAYLQIYLDTNFGNSKSVFDLGYSDYILDINKEYGWAFINRIAGVLNIGFFGMVLALTIFECWSVYRIINKYVPKNFYWVAILTWFFTASSFCVNASMMRQYLCMCIYLFVIDMMIEKRIKYYWLWSIVIILVSTLIHRSSVILLLSLPLFYIKIDKSKSAYLWVTILGVVFVLWDLFGRQFIEPYMTLFLQESDDYSQYLRYMDQERTGGIGTGLGVIFQYIMFVAWLLLLPKLDRKKQSIVILLIASYFFKVIGGIAPLAGRLGLYFSFLSMVCWSWLVEKGKEEKLWYGLFAINIAVIIYTMPKFFYSEVWREYFFNYQTIFSAPYWM